MKRVAFVFSSAPHGSASGREGLDALLATSALTEEIGVFFVGDGVFQLLSGQRPQRCWRDYISTFKLLSLYDIEQCWICAASARELRSEFCHAVGCWWRMAGAGGLRARLDDFNVILRFEARMLHTLSTSPWHADMAAMLRLLKEGDDLLLLSDGVIAALAEGRFLEILQSAPISLYALQEDIEAGGLAGQIAGQCRQG